MAKSLRTHIEELRLSIFANKFDTIDNAREKFLNARMEAIIDAVDELREQLPESDKKRKK